ncbi:MAG: AmmeMemoRadiSam system protein B [Gammaproteobacteria bacterium]
MIRHPAVAGSFYPSDAKHLQQEVDRYLREAAVPTTPAPKAIVVPHAGYIYSGPVAASAYRCLQPVCETIRRVVLLGPSHRVAFRGLALSRAGSFHTPLGDIPLDTDLIATLEDLPFVQYVEQAHSYEHSLEVHLPFLQLTLEHFKLVPIVAGDATAEQVCEVLERLWGGSETLIVVSSDLSHYHDYATAKRLDRETTDKIEHLQYEQLHYDSACGRVPISGLLALARKKSLHVKNIDLRNSGDTAGDKQRVVGYGAYVVD